MRVEEFAETLSPRLHAELDQLTVPARGWLTARPDLRRRLRRRRARHALAAAVSVAAIAIAATLAHAGSHPTVHRLPPPIASVRLRQLASRSFASSDPAPQPAALLAYGGGRLFAVVFGQRRTPLLRLDPVNLRVTGKLRASSAVAPVYGAGADGSPAAPTGVSSGGSTRLACGSAAGFSSPPGSPRWPSATADYGSLTVPLAPQRTLPARPATPGADRSPEREGHRYRHPAHHGQLGRAGRPDGSSWFLARTRRSSRSTRGLLPSARPSTSTATAAGAPPASRSDLTGSTRCPAARWSASTLPLAGSPPGGRGSHSISTAP